MFYLPFYAASSVITSVNIIFLFVMHLYQAPFDTASVDNMRRLADHSGAPGHIYPLALLCYDIMPPPLQVHSV